MKRKLTTLMLMTPLLALGDWGGISNIVITPPPADSIPVMASKINGNFSWLLAHGGGGSGSNGNYIAMTNGYGINLTASNQLTLADVYRVPAWLQVTNITFPTNITDGAGSTNSADPYIYDTATGGYTNQAGYTFYYGGFPAYSETNTLTTVENLLTNSGVANLYKITVSGGTGFNGVYTLTNGFYISSANNSISFLTAGGSWKLANANNSLSFAGPVRASPLGTWGDGPVLTAAEYHTNYGFQARTFVPQFRHVVYNARWSEMNGLYSPYAGGDKGGWTFTNMSGNGCSLNGGYTGSARDARVNGSAGRYVRDTPDYFNPTTQQRTNNLLENEWDGSSYAFNGVTAMGKIPVPAGMTNLIVIAPPPAAGSHGTVGITSSPPGLRWTTNGVCSYLVNASSYMHSINEMNAMTEPMVTSMLTLDNQGTAVLVLANVTVRVMPQSDTSEWKTCP